MKKIIIIFSLFLISTSVFAGELTAKAVTTEAAEKDTVEESISYLKEQVNKIKNPAEKRSVYIFMASLQELLSMYDEAIASYAAAAGIAAGNGEGMVPRSNEQIVLDAVRCALNIGDFATADSFLNSAVRNSKDQTIQAYINLYTQWSALCKAESLEETQEPIVMLQAYLQIKSMEIVKPSILLTLWYITGDNKYANDLKKDYPSSIEMAVVKGDVQLLPTPFWFFVPKSGDIDFSSADMEIADVKTSVEKSPEASKETVGNNGTEDFKLQVGFFKTENNANALCKELKSKGFNASIMTEVKPSGTTYYLVIVQNDSKGNVADRLRSAGYDCYLL